MQMYRVVPQTKSKTSQMQYSYLFPYIWSWCFVCIVSCTLCCSGCF